MLGCIANSPRDAAFGVPLPFSGNQQGGLSLPLTTGFAQAAPDKQASALVAPVITTIQSQGPHERPRDPRPHSQKEYTKLTCCRRARRAVYAALPPPALAVDELWIAPRPPTRLLLTNLEQLTSASVIRNSLVAAGYGNIKECEVILDTVTGASARIAKVVIDGECLIAYRCAKKLVQDARSGNLFVNGRQISAQLDGDGKLAERALQRLREQHERENERLWREQERERDRLRQEQEAKRREQELLLLREQERLRQAELQHQRALEFQLSQEARLPRPNYGQEAREDARKVEPRRVAESPIAQTLRPGVTSATSSIARPRPAIPLPQSVPHAELPYSSISSQTQPINSQLETRAPENYLPTRDQPISAVLPNTLPGPSSSPSSSSSSSSTNNLNRVSANLSAALAPYKTQVRSCIEPTEDDRDVYLSVKDLAWRTRRIGHRPYLYMPMNRPKADRSLESALRRALQDFHYTELIVNIKCAAVLFDQVEEASRCYDYINGSYFSDVCVQFQFRYGPSRDVMMRKSGEPEMKAKLAELSAKKERTRTLMMKSLMKMLRVETESQMQREARLYELSQQEKEPFAAVPIKLDSHYSFKIKKRGFKREASPGRLEANPAKKRNSQTLTKDHHPESSGGSHSLSKDSVAEGTSQHADHSQLVSPAQSPVEVQPAVAGSENNLIETNKSDSTTIIPELSETHAYSSSLSSPSSPFPVSSSSSASVDNETKHKELVTIPDSQLSSEVEPPVAKSAHKKEGSQVVHGIVEKRVKPSKEKSATEQTPKQKSKEQLAMEAKMSEVFTPQARMTLKLAPLKRALHATEWMFNDEFHGATRKDFERWQASMKSSVEGDADSAKPIADTSQSQGPQPALPVPLRGKSLTYEPEDFLSVTELLSMIVTTEDAEIVRQLAPISRAQPNSEYWQKLMQLQEIAAAPPTLVDLELSPANLLEYQLTTQDQLPWRLRGLEATQIEDVRKMPPKRRGRISSWRQRQTVTGLLGIHDNLVSEINEGPPGQVPDGAPRPIVRLMSTAPSNPINRHTKKVSFARSSIHSWGLFAGEPILKGDLIIEYVGELKPIYLSDYQELKYLREGSESTYMFQLDQGQVIDATQKGSVARLINHSCAPNCLARTMLVNKTKRIAIYAKRNIRPHEELTYDYKFEAEAGERRVPCRCGSKHCRGFLN